jgi:maltooligosyltrehalose trehalohydrolase
MRLSVDSIKPDLFPRHFTTRIVPGGGVFFQLWAPMAGTVDLCLDRHDGNAVVVPMQPMRDGWFVFHHEGAKAQDHYQYRIDGTLRVPDPASRCQAGDIHGPSVICDPLAFTWMDRNWQGRPWEETVMYELHVGTFSPEGTFEGVRRRLDHLRETGITAVELMPVAHFPGACNWGYDGALIFAPCNRYGSPHDLKNLVQAAHNMGLMVFLDVVYNHFGPEGNYLHVYARDAFFTDEHHTPWGAAVRFTGRHSRHVRDFFIANALYWLEEFHLDGLRVDAAHAIVDPSEPDILEEIALAVQRGPGRARHIHLIVENDNNSTRYIGRTGQGRPRFYSAQWNDDLHHSLHVLLTGETGGYYGDYSPEPVGHLARCLAQGFAYQGEVSPFRGNRPRGSPSAGLPPLAFISFLQNHDQVGNRAFGERLACLCDPDELRLCVALVALAPHPPLFFMGEEFNAATPFYYFCDYGPGLAESVTSGRREEFATLHDFREPESRKAIPDPNAPSTFSASKIDWQHRSSKRGREYLCFFRELLQLRQREIVPCLHAIAAYRSGALALGAKALHAWWKLGEGCILSVLLNLHRHAIELPPGLPGGRVLFRLSVGDAPAQGEGRLAPLTIIWTSGHGGGWDG